MDPTAKLIITLGVIVVLIVLIFKNIRIVPQTSEFIIERLGKYKKKWSAGLHFKVPFIDRIASTVTLK